MASQMEQKALNPLDMEFAKKLNKLMAERDVTYEEVAKHVGVGTTTVFRWLNQKGKPLRPRLDEAARLAELLGVGVDYLADDALDAPPPPGLSPQEELLLDLIRRMGVNEASDRLSLVRTGSAGYSPRATPRPTAGEPPRIKSAGQGAVKGQGSPPRGKAGNGGAT